MFNLGPGIPPDSAAWLALLSALVMAAAWRACGGWIRSHPGAVLALLSFGAGLLSLAYIHSYLRGGPRIIDATSYYLEARLIAEGGLSFDPVGPSGSFRGRFLTGPEFETTLSVIFPPGYPLLLSLGFVIGKPLWIGPALAALLVLVSHQLTVRLFDDRGAALGAAALSALCAALRYHTADTMSHGWAALLFALCLLSLCYPGRRFAVLGGIAAGWLLATRPITGILCVLCALYWLGAHRRSLWFLLALVPGLALLAAHQRAATGSWFESAQLHYYALADGPPGCFTYGFGRSVGCVYEHGDVVARMPDGFGPGLALVNSLHRFSWHMLDVANLELLWFVVPYAIYSGRRLKAVRLLALGVFGIVVAYAPFYFNGSYPGGGARFFADALPLEHALMAFGLTRLRGFRAALPLCLVGFAVRGAYAHHALAERDGGRPMFEASLLEKYDIRRGLLFVGTDHGFNLAFDPGARDARREVVVARDRGDAHDRVLWEQLGRPPAYRYLFEPWSRNVPRIEPGAPEPTHELTFEGEYEWPPLSVRAGYARPAHVGVPCASNGRVLELVPSAGGELSVELEVVVPKSGSYRLELGWVKPPSSHTRYTVRALGREWRGEVRFETTPCETVELGASSPPPGAQRISIALNRHLARLDFVRLKELPLSRP